MADPLKPPRPALAPPALPEQPFALVDRSAETPRLGTVLRRDEIPPPPRAPVSILDVMQSLEQALRAHSDKLDAQQASMAPVGPSQMSEPPVSSAPKSKALVVAGAAAKHTINFGKWTTIVMGGLVWAGIIAHQFRPDLEGPIQAAINVFKALGGHP